MCVFFDLGNEGKTLDLEFRVLIIIMLSLSVIERDILNDNIKILCKYVIWDLFLL